VSRLAALTIVSLVVSTTAPAQTARDPESTVVGELVVTATLPGPAWWSVTRGESTVWILSAPAALPRGFAWDRAVLRRRLALSREVIMPPAATAGLGDVFAFLSARAKLRTKAPLEQRAPREVSARFLAATAALRRPASTYDHWNGVGAAMIMAWDFRRGLGIDPQEPLPAIEQEARRAHVPIVYAAKYRAITAVRAAVAEVTPVIEWTCLDAASDEIAGGRARFDEAAAGWGRGDTRAALNAGRGFEACLYAIPVGAGIAREVIADATQAIETALKTPGHVVAVVPVRTLLAEDGVLDRLRRRGYTVSGRGD
jgi:hypothetical protein